MNVVTHEHLIRALSGLGVRSGSMLMMHSSLSSFGMLEGGADSLIESLLAAAGPEGLVMVPTFTYGREPFDLKKTPSATGRVTEQFRLRPDVVRSAHPTHSVAAWGRDAEAATGGHDVEAAFGAGTPLDRLVEAGGDVLLVGVSHVASSVIHVAQERACVPYLDRPKTVLVVGADGTQQPRRVRRAGCSLGFDRLGPLVGHLVRRIQVGTSTLQLIPAKGVVEIAADTLRRDPAALFCDRADCFACTEAAAMLVRS